MKVAAILVQGRASEGDAEAALTVVERFQARGWTQDALDIVRLAAVRHHDRACGDFAAACMPLFALVARAVRVYQSRTFAPAPVVPRLAGRVVGRLRRAA